MDFGMLSRFGRSSILYDMYRYRKKAASDGSRGNKVGRALYTWYVGR